MGSKGITCFFIMGTLLAAGCGKEKEKDKMHCPALAADQQGSFTEKVSNFPLELEVPTGSLPQVEMAAQTGAHEWNRIAKNSGISEAFHVASVTGEPSGMDCDSILGLGLGDRNVRISSMSQGGNSSNLLAITIRCLRSTDGALQGQAVFVREEAISPIQIGSVITHEMGHSLGLDHSCKNGQGESDFRSCSGLSETHPYTVAVMFPSLASNLVKETLQANDVDRFNCLY